MAVYKVPSQILNVLVCVRRFQRGSFQQVYLVYLLFIAKHHSHVWLTVTLHCSPQHGRLRPTSQPRKSQQIAPSYLNPIICTGHSAVHCGKVRGIILARGYHLITYSHLVAKTNLSAKSWGSTHQVVVQKKASLHSFSLEATKNKKSSSFPWFPTCCAPS